MMQIHDSLGCSPGMGCGIVSSLYLQSHLFNPFLQLQKNNNNKQQTCTSYEGGGGGGGKSGKCFILKSLL